MDGGYFQSRQDRHYMLLALEEAKKAFALGEIPVGALIVRGEEILAAGHNRRETDRDPLGHAELAAISRAAARLGSWRLEGCTLYVTLEPCAMCAGAIINARIPRVVYGAADPRAGCCGSAANFFAMPFSHCPALTTGVEAEACQALLREFFQSLRREGAAKRAAGQPQ